MWKWNSLTFILFIEEIIAFILKKPEKCIAINQFRNSEYSGSCFTFSSGNNKSE